MSYVVDYAWGRPSVGTMKADGCTGVARYLAPADEGKQLTPDEAARLHAGGLATVVVYESTADFTLGGYSAGVEIARAGFAQAQAAGMPAGRPIYFAVDFDANQNQQLVINEFLRGCGDVLGGPQNVGIYGGYWVVKRAMEANRAQWGWQTTAWSAGMRYPGAHLYQDGYNWMLDGVNCDRNEILKADYGQWGVGAVPTPVKEFTMDADAQKAFAVLDAADAALKSELDSVRAALGQMGVMLGSWQPYIQQTHSAAINAASGVGTVQRSVDAASADVTSVVSLVKAIPAPGDVKVSLDTDTLNAAVVAAFQQMLPQITSNVLGQLNLKQVAA